MLKYKKMISCALATMLAMQGGGLVFAGENSVQLNNYKSKLVANLNNGVDVTKKEFSKYDKYVKVIDNKYVLELPSNIKIPNETLKKVQAQIDCSNRLISENNLTINPQTKSAIKLGKCTDGEGVNSVEFYWNYMRVNISVSNWRILLTMGAGAIEGFLMELLSISGPVAVGIAGAIGAGLSSIIGEYVKDGVWFDLNHFFVFLDKWGYQ